MKVGKGTKTRIINIKSIRDSVIEKYDEHFFNALLGLHAFTGCDSISSFAGKGKVKAINIFMKYPEFIPFFSELDKNWVATEELIDNLEEFVCVLYGKKMSSIDTLRHQLFCAKGGKVDPEQLPPCKSSLALHIRRANYQACVWRRALNANPRIPSPNGHGWDADDTNISIKWLDASPAPEEILELLNCLCKRSCKRETCCCIQAGLLCTEICTATCDNMLSEEISQDSDDINDIEGSDIENDDE